MNSSVGLLSITCHLIEHTGETRSADGPHAHTLTHIQCEQHFCIEKCGALGIQHREAASDVATNRHLHTSCLRIAQNSLTRSNRSKLQALRDSSKSVMSRSQVWPEVITRIWVFILHKWFVCFDYWGSRASDCYGHYAPICTNRINLSSKRAFDKFPLSYLPKRRVKRWRAPELY